MAVLTITSSGTLGDHFPFLALGRALALRGHQVRYAAPRYLLPHVEACGLTYYPGRPEHDPAAVRKRPEAFDHWLEAKGGPRAAGLVDEVDLYEKLHFDERLDDVLAACEGADLLICSRLQIVGRMVSDLAGLPWITACVLPWLYPDADSPAAAGVAAREAKGAVLPANRRFRDRIHALRAHHRLTAIPREQETQLFEARRILLATSPRFGQPPAQPGRELVQTGFWLHRPPQWPADPLPPQLDHPLVLAFSSQPLADPGGVLDLHLATARLLGQVLVAQAGWAELRSPRFTEACRNGEAFLLPEGPQDELFFRAGAVITHGGIGTVARAISAGAPLLVEPYGNDQFYNARQVVALGVGAAVNPHNLTPAGLAQVLESRVLPTNVRRRSREIGAELDSEVSLLRACQQIERWLE